MPIQIEIASPCSANWEQMSGNARARMCALCNKKVHNLDGLSEREILELIGVGQSRCVRFFQRADGTVLTEDCPVGVWMRARRAAKRAWLGAAAAVLGVLATLGFCSAQSDAPFALGPLERKPPVHVEPVAEAVPTLPDHVRFGGTRATMQTLITGERTTHTMGRIRTIGVIKGVIESKRGTP